MSGPKRRLFDHFARVGKALASPARLELLDLLAQGEKPVDLLARQSGLSVTNTSNHLKELRTAGLVTSRKEGAFVFYQLADGSVHELLRVLQSVAERRIAELRDVVREHFEEADELEPVPAPELLERLRTRDVVVLDVRPADEYAAGHVPGAISMPAGELEGRLSELPSDREIVAYCRGPYCVLSLQALAVLRAHGYRARRMTDGIPDWRARGFAVASGT